VLILLGLALARLRPLFGLDRQLHATGSQCGYRFNTYIGLAVAGSLFGTEGVALAALLLGVMIPLANFCAVAVPAIAFGLARWLGAGPLEAGVLVLCAALPTATNAYILAVRMTGDGRAVAMQVTIGTVLSMATLPLWLVATRGYL
jgi:predicted permease